MTLISQVKLAVVGLLIFVAAGQSEGAGTRISVVNYEALENLAMLLGAETSSVVFVVGNPAEMLPGLNKHFVGDAHTMSLAQAAADPSAFQALAASNLVLINAVGEGVLLPTSADLHTQLTKILPVDGVKFNAKRVVIAIGNEDEEVAWHLAAKEMPDFHGSSGSRDLNLDRIVMDRSEHGYWVTGDQFVTPSSRAGLFPFLEERKRTSTIFFAHWLQELRSTKSSWWRDLVETSATTSRLYGLSQRHYAQTGIVIAFSKSALEVWQERCRQILELGQEKCSEESEFQVLAEQAHTGDRLYVISADASRASLNVQPINRDAISAMSSLPDALALLFAADVAVRIDNEKINDEDVIANYLARTLGLQSLQDLNQFNFQTFPLNPTSQIPLKELAASRTASKIVHTLAWKHIAAVVRLALARSLPNEGEHHDLPIWLYQGILNAVRDGTEE